MDHGKEGEGMFFVAGRDAAELLGLIVESFDAIALLVFSFVIHKGFDAVAASGDYRLDSIHQ